MKVLVSEWIMRDAEQREVRSPCCEARWLEPLMFTILCASCGKTYWAEKLGIVGGERWVIR